MIIAKPVIADQFWILHQDNQKIGNLEAVGDGYQVRIRNQVAQFKTIQLLADVANIQFESTASAQQPANQVHGYAVNGAVHNAIWNLQHKLPLFTRSAKSKSWFAAGWYRVQRGRSWQLLHEPKLIALQRYVFQGPFHSKEQARGSV
jgi:hypothetical protein